MRLAVLGIDGGSWNIIEWLVREGYMPNLRRLIGKGVHGILRSIVPPVTGGVWLSIATGLNPGKTGVIDFFKHVSGSMLELVSSEDFRGKSVWDYLSVLDYRVAVLDYPMLYPAYSVNGIMLCSWGGKVSTYPASLINDVKGIIGEYNIFVDYHLEKYNNVDLFLEDLSKAFEKKLKVSRYFMKKSWDLFIDVISFTDWLQHRMWHYIDPSYPWYPGNEDASRYRRRFVEYWQLVDEYIGEVAKAFGITLIVSDHGFGPQWGVFNLARWLLEHGFVVVRRRNIGTVLASVINRLKLYKAIPKRLRRRAREKGLSPISPAFYYDMDKSEVVAPQYTIPFGAVHVNPRFREHAKEILKKLEKELERLPKEIGKELKVSIWRSKDIYSGNTLEHLPDLIFTINDWSCVIVKDPTRNFIYLDEPYSPRHTGSHRLYGIFIAWGNDIRKGVKVGEANILDIAPTILHVLNAPIPRNMDGKVLAEIFEPDSGSAKKPPKYVDPSYYVRLHLAKKAELLREKLEG